MRIALRLFATLALALAGCSTFHAAVENGTAKLLPNSVTIGFSQFTPANPVIYGVIEEPYGRRDRISVTPADCRVGVGTIYFAGGDSPVNYLVSAADKPKDQIFKGLCTIGLPLINEHFAQPMGTHS